MNSSSDISPFPSKSTESKNSFADNFAKFDFQCSKASFLSISLLPSLSNIAKTSIISFSKSYDISSSRNLSLELFVPIILFSNLI